MGKDNPWVPVTRMGKDMRKNFYPCIGMNKLTSKIFFLYTLLSIDTACVSAWAWYRIFDSMKDSAFRPSGAFQCHDFLFGKRDLDRYTQHERTRARAQ
jgi:hypothetical protein